MLPLLCRYFVTADGVDDIVDVEVAPALLPTTMLMSRLISRLVWLW